MSKRLLAKPFWKEPKVAAERSKRLKLTPDENNLFICPVDNCDSEPYKSQRGCRKHVYNKHGWFYYFYTKPYVNDAFPERTTRMGTCIRTKKCSTVGLPSFVNPILGGGGILTSYSGGGGGKITSPILTAVLVVQFSSTLVRISNCQSVLNFWKKNQNL